MEKKQYIQPEVSKYQMRFQPLMDATVNHSTTIDDDDSDFELGAKDGMKLHDVWED